MTGNKGPVKEEAVILRRIRHGESSRIVTLFGRTLGKFAVIAKGARSGRGTATGSAIEPPGLIEAMVYFKSGRSVQTLGQVSVIDNYSELKSDMVASAYSSAILEAVNRAFLDGESNETAFAAILRTLTSLSTDEVDKRMILWLFQLDLIRAVGFGVDAHVCPVCGKSEAMTSGQNPFWFERGAICCSTCRPEGGAIRMLSGESVRILRQLSSANGQVLSRIKPSTVARNELTSALAEFLKFHYPGMGKLPALEMLNQLENI